MAAGAEMCARRLSLSTSSGLYVCIRTKLSACQEEGAEDEKDMSIRIAVSSRGGEDIRVTPRVHAAGVGICWYRFWDNPKVTFFGGWVYYTLFLFTFVLHALGKHIQQKQTKNIYIFFFIC